jgi:serine/threonine protein kinase
MLQPKQRLGDFEIIRLLGKGGMGEVYEAQQFHPERRVALKVLAPWLAEDQQALDRFWREANVPAQLDHPGVVRIIQTGKTDNTAYYTMQLVRGISLADLIRKADSARADTVAYEPSDTSPTATNNSPPPQEAETLTFDSSPPPSVVQDYRQDRFRTLAKIGVNAARALDSAHRQGFLHRDIKPSNLMIDHHNQLYLVDFGLTRALDSATGTRAGTVIGTPWFMSPEQALGHPLDGRSDIFSLGVTLYQLATGGKGPYTAKRGDTDAVLREVRSGTLQPIEQLAPETPPGLERIITRAIAAKPEDRYQTAAEMADDLETFLASGTVPITPSAKSASHGRRWRWLAIAAGIAIAVGLTIALSPRGHKGNEKPPENQGPPAIAEKLPFERDRPLGTVVNLLRKDNQPIEYRKVGGVGDLTPLPTELVLKEVNGQPFFVAIDHPNIGDFDFAVECKAFAQKAPLQNDLGLFFGWRENLPDPKAQMRFFALKLDTRPEMDDKYGRLYCGTWQSGGAISEQNPRHLHPKSPDGWVPLPDPKTLKDAGWYPIKVLIRGQSFDVELNGKRVRSFTMAGAINNDPPLATYALECKGMLGLWVRGGAGSFRNATVTAAGP